MEDGKRKVVHYKVPKSIPPVIIDGIEVAYLDFEEDEIFLERARTELRETPEVVKEAYEELNRLLDEEEPDLIVPREPEFLKRFLRPCKWYPKSSLQLMKRYYTFRAANSKLCHNLIPSEEPKAFESDLIVQLPVRMKDGCRVFLVECGKKWVPKEVQFNMSCRSIMIQTFAVALEPKTQISGLHVIFDADGFSLGHLPAFSPYLIASLCEWVQKCQTVRVKGIHLVNQPFVFNMCFALFKPFLMEKFRKRIIFHGTNRESLFEYVDRETLPPHLGGTLKLPKQSLGKEVLQYLKNYDDHLREEQKYGYTRLRATKE